MFVWLDPLKRHVFHGTFSQVDLTTSEQTLQEGGISDDVWREAELFCKTNGCCETVDIARAGVVPEDGVDGDDVAFGRVSGG